MQRNSYGYIYKTTNLINGRIYIGRKKGDVDLNYLGSGLILNKAIRKYGRDNFKTVVIAFSSTEEMLNALEVKYIYEHRKVLGKAFLYNISKGGDRGPGNYKHLSFNKGKLPWINGKHHTEKTKKILSLAHTGKKHSEEHKRNNALARIGKKRPLQMRRNLSIAKKGCIPWNKGKRKVALHGA